MARLIPTTNQEDRMGHAGPGAAPLYPKVRFGFTDHPITVWAGVILLRLYFELVGLRTQLTAVLGAFDKRSNNQIPATDVLLCWFYGLALGAARFEHFTRYRRDPLLPRLLGVRRFPSPDTLRRLFGAFTYRTTTEVSEALLRWGVRAMRPILLGHTLDLDSTVCCRYGDQEGSLKGYNPIKPGRPSHHPLLAFLCEARRVVWATVRAGHAGTASGASSSSAFQRRRGGPWPPASTWRISRRRSPGGGVSGAGSSVFVNGSPSGPRLEGAGRSICRAIPSPSSSRPG